MAPKPASNSMTNSGIKQTGNGESVIPASTRADGSVRKEIRVKAGYKPPEDVEVYKNRTAEAWKNRGKGGVLGAETAVAEEKLPPHKFAGNKNAKRREARKKAAAAGTGEDAVGEQNESCELKVNGTTEQTNGDNLESKPEAPDPEAEKAKEARKLSKKLRQARELQEKKENGDNLLPEQVEKVIKINELIRQLNGLGFDAEGERKDPLDGEAAAD